MSLESDTPDLRTAVVAISLLVWAGAQEQRQKGKPMKVKDLCHTIADNVVDWHSSGMDVANWLFAIGIDEEAIMQVMPATEKPE
jgi:hypothetical protein